MMQTFYRNKRIFLTGNTGFKGAWLALILKSLGAKVYGYSLKPDDFRGNFYNIIKLENIVDSSIIGDICDLEKLKKAYDDARPDIVFHLAAQPFVLRSYKDPIETYKTNIIGLANLFEVARNSEHKSKVILNVTTDKCYENKEWSYAYRENDRLGGHDPYSASKAMAELLTASYRKSFFYDNKTVIVTARGGNVIGGGDFGENRLIPDFIDSIIKNKPLYIRNPYSIRPWQYILDVLNGYMTLVKKCYETEEMPYNSFNFGPENINSMNVKNVIDQMMKYLGMGEVNIQDNPLHEAHYLKLDINLSKDYLNWKPRVNTEKAIELTANWYKSYFLNENMMKKSENEINNYFYEM